MMSKQQVGQLIEMDKLKVAEVAVLAKTGATFKVALIPTKKRGKVWYRCDFVVESIRYHEKSSGVTSLITYRNETWMMFDLNRAIQHLMKIFPNVEKIEVHLPRNMGLEKDEAEE